MSVDTAKKLTWLPVINTHDWDNPSPPLRPSNRSWSHAKSALHPLTSSLDQGNHELRYWGYPSSKLLKAVSFINKIPHICWCWVQEDVINFRRDFVLSLHAARIRRSVESSLEIISTASIISLMKLKYPPLKEPSYMQWDIGGPPLTDSSTRENGVVLVDGGYPMRLALINHTQVSENNEVLTSKWKALGTQCRTPWNFSMKLSLCWPRYPGLGSEYRELAANETALFNS